MSYFTTIRHLYSHDGTDLRYECGELPGMTTRGLLAGPLIEAYGYGAFCCPECVSKAAKELAVPIEVPC